MSDHHDILGVTPDTSLEDIRKAWLKLCLEHHPDKGGDTDIFIKITHSYRCLTDPSYQVSNAGQPVRDLDYKIKLSITFEEAFFGTNVVVAFNQFVVDNKMQIIKNDKIEMVTVSIEVLAGTPNGWQHVEKGVGIKYGTQTGNALFIFSVLDHERFWMEGFNVVSEERVPLHTMLKGGEVLVQTMWGQYPLWIHPGTAPDEAFLIPGYGLARQHNHVVKVKPVFPSMNDLKADHWSGLNINWAKAQVLKEEADHLILKYEELRRERDTKTASEAPKTDG